MPHIQIKLLAGKTEAQKEALANAVVQSAQEVIGYGDESYSVSIEDVSWEVWKTELYPNEIMGKQDILYKKPGYTV